MSRKTNLRKDSFLSKIPTASFYTKADTVAHKCKFNFSYLDVSQEAGQSFKDWTKDQICKLLDKLQYYCKHPLKHWTNQRIGSASNKVLEVYGGFPKKSEFDHPKHVPHEAKWARLRLEGAVRLIGFVVPDEMHDKTCEHTKVRFDSNTFYIVFLDANHKFYLTSK